MDNNDNYNNNSDNKFLSLKNIVIILLTLGIVALCIFSVDVLLILYAAFVITCALSPLVNKMEKFIPRVWAVTIVLFSLIAAIFLILVPLISISLKEVSGLSGAIDKVLDSIGNLLNIQIFNKSLSEYITFEFLKDGLSSSLNHIIENSINAGKRIIDLLSTVFAISIMVFYFIYDEKRLKDKFIEFFSPEQKEKARSIMENISSKVGNYILAQGIAMIFVGALTTIGLLLIHNSHAFLLGVITCLLDIIPVIGPAVAILISLITAASGGFLYILLTFTVCIIAQWAQNQLLRPIVFGKLLNMHPLMIITFLLISAKFLGILGIILSPAIACSICTLVDELYLNRINAKED